MGAAIGGSALRSQLSLAAGVNNGHPLAPRKTHLPGKAKRLVVFFMTGGISHVDTFDHKPKINRDAGKKFGKSRIKASQFAFQEYGQTGRMVSELLPHCGSIIDEFCLIHSMSNKSGGHSAATLGMHTGSITIPLPSIGSWVSHGLGTLNTNLPSFVVFAEKEPYNAYQCWDSNFLPGFHTGVRVVPGEQPIPHLHSKVKSLKRQELERMMLQDLNEDHLKLHPNDVKLKTRMTNFDTAYGLMKEAPEAFDTSRELDSTLKLYGVDREDRKSFGWQCLATRRLLERGVRVVELFDIGSNRNWDAHGDMETHRPLARKLDQPMAALIKDLKLRGMLEDTLIVGCSEFGRTPWEDRNPKGRGHHSAVFTTFFVGGGSKAGLSYGASDDIGAKIAEDGMEIHDFHATILHLMGLDHTELTYRYSGRDFRLTDVHGHVPAALVS
tara:strand:- start:633 stop:1952 length:1320 start_codon:yes stop_codon:yes gene_type:complete